jgi:hypothetical protein
MQCSLASLLYCQFVAQPCFLDVPPLCSAVSCLHVWCSQVKPPGIGAETTLVLTDVEGSTTLFEELPQVRGVVYTQVAAGIGHLRVQL